jgi:hypothetical protein
MGLFLMTCSSCGHAADASPGLYRRIEPMFFSRLAGPPRLTRQGLQSPRSSRQISRASELISAYGLAPSRLTAPKRASRPTG